MNKRKQQKKKLREKRIQKEKNIRTNNTASVGCALCVNGIEHNHADENKTFIENL
jgi:hypothetical protein